MANITDEIAENTSIFETLLESKENLRRLNMQRSLNNRQKVIAFNSWCWGGGISLGDRESPIQGMSIREMALKLDTVDASI